MKRRLITVMLFALLAAAASSTLLYKVISANSRPQGKSETSTVLVAAKDLNAGALVSDSDLRETEWPAAGAEPWLRRRQDAVGRALLQPMSKDEPLAENRLAPKGSGAGLASRIPSGMRAIAVHVDELTGLSRYLFTGMHVDVISTGTGASPGGQAMTTRTILQNIEVFSTGQSIERDAREKAAVSQTFNLLVTPQQAEILSQAVAHTRIELVLRNPLDNSSYTAAAPETQAVPAAPASLFAKVKTAKVVRVSALEKALAAPPRPPAAPTVEVIHGTKRAVSEVAAVSDLKVQP